jgi:transketolase
MLLYSLLYLTGYGLTLDDIRSFRQWGSRTPGHPEYRLTPGVEATAGPLGQGFANGIGMAMAERWLAARYNRPGFEIINHYTYSLVSDGDLQEGVASEAASLAGNLKLGKLIYIYDSNDVQQDGPTVSFTENVSQRFQAYGWNVIGPINGMKTGAVSQALRSAQSRNEQPNLIICKTIIGFGSPHKAGTNAAHGEHLGSEEVHLTREKLHWPYPEPFKIPQEVLTHMRLAQNRGKDQQADWQKKMEAYRQIYLAEYAQLAADLKGDLPADWEIGLSALKTGVTPPVSTRDISGRILNYVSENVPSLIGGAADLAGSTRTLLKKSSDFASTNYSGRNIHYGLREHAMGAISNGLALHGGTIPFAGTFLIFLDYLRPSLRLAAIMKLRVIYIFTHDSIALGEDGPTHQPVEQIMSLRMIPDLLVLRPADAAETVECWKRALEHREGPVALILTRQYVPVLNRSELAPASNVHKGGYILWETDSSPRIILIGTGSEVNIALEAGKLLHQQGIQVRVVSMPSWSLFDSQPAEYRNNVLPPRVKARVSIEAGTTLGWEKYIGLNGTALGVSHFGHSAPGEIIYSKLGLNPQHMVEESLKLL